MIKVCEFCSVGNVPLKRCSRCNAVTYCSKTCQKAHWEFHSHFCKSEGGEGGRGVLGKLPTCEKSIRRLYENYMGVQASNRTLRTFSEEEQVERYSRDFTFWSCVSEKFKECGSKLMFLAAECKIQSWERIHRFPARMQELFTGAYLARLNSDFLQQYPQFS